MNFSQIGGCVEVAIGRTNDVYALDAVICLFGFALLCFSLTKLIPEPHQCPIRALPLIFVNGARQESLYVGVLGCDATANHFGDGAGDHHAGFFGVKHLVRAPQGALGAALSELFLGQTGDHDR